MQVISFIFLLSSSYFIFIVSGFALNKPPGPDNNGLTNEEIESLKTLINNEKMELSKRKIFISGDHPSLITTNQYHNLNEIYAYLDSIAKTYPPIVSGASIGKSFENREIKYLKIGKNNGNKNAAFLNGCSHSREWLACATLVYIINELTTQQDKYDDLLTNLDIYILPIMNPDGYIYSWEHDRAWKKTRSGPRQGCYGVDANRNWNYKWGTADDSTHPCDEHYDGPKANSEIEVENLSKFLELNNSTIKVFFDLHTNGEDFVYPFGYDHVYPTNVDKMKKVAAEAVVAINKIHDSQFVFGSVIDVVSADSGTAIDYAKGFLGIDYTFEIDLRPNKNATNGFILPANQIQDGASEAWAGIQVVLRAAIDDYKNGNNGYQNLPKIHIAFLLLSFCYFF